MNRDQFVQQYMHQFCGMLLEAWADQRRGADASLWLQQSYRKVHALLAQMYDAAAAKNGQAVKPTKPSPAHQEGGN